MTPADLATMRRFLAAADERSHARDGWEWLDKPLLSKREAAFARKLKAESAYAAARADFLALIKGAGEPDRGTAAQKIRAGLRDALLVTKIAGEAVRNFPPGTVTPGLFNEVLAAIAPHVTAAAPLDGPEAPGD